MHAVLNRDVDGASIVLSRLCQLLAEELQSESVIPHLCKLVESQLCHIGGDFSESERLLFESLDGNRRILGPSHQELAGIYLEGSRLMTGQKKLAKADELIGKAIQVAKSGCRSGDPEASFAFLKIGLNEVNLNRIDKADECFEAASNCQLNEQLSKERQFELWHGLGVAYQMLGRHVDAIRHFELANLHAAKSPERELGLANLAYSLVAIDDTENAKRVYADAFEEFDWSLPLTQATSFAINGLALFKLKLGHWEEAHDHFSRLYNELRFLLSPSDPIVVTAKHNLGAVMSLLGYAGAGDLLLSALKDREHGSGIGQQRDIAESLHAMAGHEERCGDTESAAGYLLRSVQLHETEAVKSLAPERVGESNYVAGAFFLRHNEFQKARKYLERSFEIYLDCSKTLATNLSQAQGLRNSLTMLAVRDALLSCLSQISEATPMDSYRFLAESHATVFNAMKSRLAHAKPNELESLRVLTSKLTAVLFSDFEPTDTISRELRIGEITLRKEALEREISGAQPPAMLDNFNLDSLGLLSNDSAFVHFVQTAAIDEITDGEIQWKTVYDAFVVTNELQAEVKVVRVRIGDAAKVDQLAIEWLASIKAGFGFNETKSDALSLRIPVNAFNTAVWQPLAELLSPFTKIKILADGSLCSVPWSALPGRNSRFLLEEKELSLVQDVSNLQCAEDVKLDFEQMCLVGNIDYEIAERNSHLACEFSRLPHTKDEIDAIQRITGCKTTECANATKARVALMLENCSVAHIACHGFFAGADQSGQLEYLLAEQKEIDGDHQSTNRRRSFSGRNLSAYCGLVLSQPNTNALSTSVAQKAQSIADAILSADEIALMNLQKCQLVVLSACESGLGEASKSEGTHSFVRSLRLAGANLVIATLWKIDDEWTSRLMRDFYEGLGANCSISELLRDAQLRIAYTDCKAVGWESSPVPPKHWASFFICK